jgi:hypothetical protein
MDMAISKRRDKLKIIMSILFFGNITEIKKYRRVRMEKRITLLALLSMLMMSVVDGVSYGINGDKTSYSGGLSLGEGVEFHGQFSVHGDNLVGNCKYVGSGKLNVDDTKKNKAGDQVTLTAKGQLSGSYKPTFSDKEAKEFTGAQEIIGTVGDINCKIEAKDRDGEFDASVSATVGQGAIDLFQSATAKKDDANAWQRISSTSQSLDDVFLKAESSDRFGDKTDSSVEVDHGTLNNFVSQAEGSYLQEKDPAKHYVEMYAINGVFNPVDNSLPDTGKISGDSIHSEGSATSQNKLTAGYDFTVKHGSIEGLFDCGTEVRQEILPGKARSDKGWVMAAPLESPSAWAVPPYSAPISIIASHISSNSKATKEKPAYADAKDVDVTDWTSDNGFAVASRTGKDPSI